MIKESYVMSFFEFLFRYHKRQGRNEQECMSDSGSSSKKVRRLKVPRRVNAESRSRAMIAVIITWIFAFVFVTSFLAVVIPVVRGAIPSPIMTNVFFSTLGYFGGALTAFMRMEVEE